MKKSIFFPLQSFLLLFVLAFGMSFLLHPVNPHDGERERSDHPLESIRFYVQRHAGSETGFIPTQHVLDEVAKARKGVYGFRKTAAPSWSDIGPNNVGGRTRALLIDPASSSVLYAAAVGGGVWKSTNSGSSWTSTTDNLGNIAFTCLAIAPGGSLGSQTIYAGTGEGYYNIDAIRGAGLYRTTNSGTTWTQIATGSAMSYYINKIVVDPTNSNYIFVATNNGLFRSTNGGTSFSSIGSFSNLVQDLAIHPTSPDTLYVAVTSTGIFKSTNAKSATRILTSIISQSGQERIEIALSSLKPAVLYAVFANTGGEPAYIGRSGNGGTTWLTGTTIPTNNDGYLSSYMNTQGWYDNTLGINPSDELTIYVAGVDAYKSSDGGSTWSKMTSWRTYTAPYVHADNHDIVFESGSTFYLVNDGGIFKTTNSGSSWASINSGYNVTQFYYGGLSNNATNVIGGAQDNGTLLYTGSSSWTSIHGGDGGASLISHTNSSEMYASYVFGYFEHSTNSGSTWSDISLNSAGNSSSFLFIAPAEMSQSNSSTLFIGGDHLYRSTNKGANWFSIYNNPGLISAIGLSLTADTIVVGTSSGGVYRTTNGGSNWATTTPSGIGYVTSAAVSFTNPNVAYVTSSGYSSGGHVYRTTNLGVASPSWTDVSGSLPSLPGLSVVIDRGDANHVFVGTDAGVFETTNGGSSWAFASSGMASAASVEDLDLTYGGHLLAATHGRGMFFSNNALPIEMSTFAAVRSGKHVQLRWSTISEMNNYGFHIQRKLSGTNTWYEIGFVRGAGTSNIPHHYIFVDEQSLEQESLYRLRQIDRDGATTYSSESRVGALASSISLDIFPNPWRIGEACSVKVFVANPTDMRLLVFDSRGRIVQESLYPMTSSSTVELSLQTALYSPGMYLVLARTEDTTVSKKFILLK